MAPSTFFLSVQLCFVFAFAFTFIVSGSSFPLLLFAVISFFLLLVGHNNDVCTIRDVYVVEANW